MMGKAAATSASTTVALALVLSLLSPPTATAETFKCSGNTTATCTSLLGFPVVNSTTTNYKTIASLFGIHLPALLSANNATAVDPSRPVSKTTVTVPIPCICSNGSGTSGNTTRYVVKKGDGLDHIARDIFGLLVMYQEVARFNNIPNPDLIYDEQVLLIPLPCSCDQVVPGEQVVHYAHKVADGETLESIASAKGVTTATIQSVNNIADPKTLKAEQVLDVPLRACGPSPSPLLVGTNLTNPANCSDGSGANTVPPGSPAGSGTTTVPPGSPAGSGATRVLPGFRWAPLLVVSHVLIFILSFPH